MPNDSDHLAARCANTYIVFFFCHNPFRNIWSFSPEKPSKVKNGLSTSRVALQNRCNQKTYTPWNNIPERIVTTALPALSAKSSPSLTWKHTTETNQHYWKDATREKLIPRKEPPISCTSILIKTILFHDKRQKIPHRKSICLAIFLKSPRLD